MSHTSIESLALESIRANTFFWRSRTIVTVADLEAGIIVTGGTKPALTKPVETEPAGPEVNILLDAADHISLLRVGEEFGAVIGECSKEFKDGIVSCKYCAETVAAAKLYALRQGCH